MTSIKRYERRNGEEGCGHSWTGMGLLVMLVTVAPGLCAKTAGCRSSKGTAMRGTLQGRESKKAIVQGKAWGRETQETEKGQ